jgi:hypothetical protein
MEIGALYSNLSIQDNKPFLFIIFMEVCFPHQYTRVQYLYIASLICILWNIYTINLFNPLGHIRYRTAENLQCECLRICTCLVEIYRSELHLYDTILLQSIVLLFTTEYYITPRKRTAFEKLIVVKMICHFLIFLGVWRLTSSSTQFRILALFYQMYAVLASRPGVVKNIL